MKRKHLLIFLTLSVSVSLFPLPTNYIGLWPFDGDVKDYSGNNLNGSVNGNTVYVPGKFGQAISLNGNSYVNMGDISTLNIANSEFSIAVWIKTTNDTTRQCIINKFYSATGHNTVGGYMLETGLTEGKIRFQLGVSNPNMVSIEVPAKYYSGDWHHIAITRTIDTVKLYFDGSMIGSSSCTGMTFYNTNAPFSVGYLAQTNGHYFIGSIDDIKIYNQILSESEITELYNYDNTRLWKQNNNNIYYNDGNVGIGTLDPSEKLEVDGNILIKDNNALILSSPNGTKFKITIDDNGNLTTSQITAIQSVKYDGDIKIYPNPTDNELSIEINQKDLIEMDAEIYTLTGKMIYMKSFNSNSFKINTSNLTTGAYILKLKDKNGNLIKDNKFVKQ